MNRGVSLVARTAALLALCTLPGMSPDDSSSPDQVEEDWQVVIASPDPTAVGPQVTTVMSPSSDPGAPFATLYLNYRDYPSWQPGGLQVKLYDATSDPTDTPPILDSDSQGSEVCETEGETITWTQQLSLSGGNLAYRIKDGRSTTWGSFGQGVGTLGLSAVTTAADLSGYRPEYSVAKSGVSWQSNRVSSMTLLRVRYYRGGSLISTDATPRTVDLSPGG